MRKALKFQRECLQNEAVASLLACMLLSFALKLAIFARKSKATRSALKLLKSCTNTCLYTISLVLSTKVKTANNKREQILRFVKFNASCILKTLNV